MVQGQGYNVQGQAAVALPSWPSAPSWCLSGTQLPLTTLFPTPKAMLNACQTACSLAHPSEGTSNPGPAVLIDLGPALVPARSSGAVGQRL